MRNRLLLIAALAAILVTLLILAPQPPICFTDIECCLSALDC